MKNIWDSQGSGHKSSVTYNVQERIIPRNWCTGNNIQYKDDTHVLITLYWSSNRKECKILSWRIEVYHNRVEKSWKVYSMCGYRV